VFARQEKPDEMARIRQTRERERRRRSEGIVGGGIMLFALPSSLAGKYRQQCIKRCAPAIKYWHYHRHRATAYWLQKKDTDRRATSFAALRCFHADPKHQRHVGTCAPASLPPRSIFQRAPPAHGNTVTKWRIKKKKASKEKKKPL